MSSLVDWHQIHDHHSNYALACSQVGSVVLLFTRFGTLLTLRALSLEAYHSRRPALELLCLTTATGAVAVGFLASILYHVLGSCRGKKENVWEIQLFAVLRESYQLGLLIVAFICGGGAAWANIVDDTFIGQDSDLVHGFSQVGRGTMLLFLDEAMCDTLSPKYKEAIRWLAVTILSRVVVLAYPATSAHVSARYSFESNSTFLLLGGGGSCLGEAGIWQCVRSTYAASAAAWAGFGMLKAARGLVYAVALRIVYGISRRYGDWFPNTV